MDKKWQQVREIFDSALRRKADERSEFVAKACGGDEGLRKEVESLLASLDSAESFLERPVVANISELELKLEKGSRLSHYEIVRQIGEGGMGIVYLGRDLRLERPVAIKLLNKRYERNEDNVRRFVREAKSASALNHPNILTIFEIGEYEGSHFIVSEYIEGQTLREIMKGERMNLRTIVDITAQIANALAAAHKARIVHRDIKPENIIVRDDGYVKVLDFGLAKLLPENVSGVFDTDILHSQNSTASGMILGTVNYMSPEQARAASIDHRTDIFSLGVVLYEMTIGVTPFKGNTPADTIAAIIQREPVPPSRTRNDVPEELDNIVAKMIKKDRAARYSSAEGLSTDLKQLQRRLELETELEATTRLKRRPEEETRVFSPTSVERISTGESSSSIAVLPFANMSADQENEYFCDGLAEEILNALAKVEDLKVAARTSAFSFKNRSIEISEIARALNVSTVLEGSVRKSGNKLRITVQLVSAADGFHLWSEKYDREMEDIFDIQDEITLAVVDTLKVKLLGDEKAAILKRSSQNAEAYELYLKGLYHSYKWTDESFVKSLEYFQKSLEKDPAFAPAYAKIADYYHFHSFVGGLSPNEVIGKRREAAERALELDESLPEAHLAMANINFYHDRNWAKAEDEFQRAIDLNPNDPRSHMLYGLFLVSRERFDEAVAQAKKALSLDPLSVAVNFVAAQTNFYADRFEYAFELVQMMRELDPNAPQSFWQEGKLLLANGRYEEAVKTLEHASTLGDNQMALSMRGCAYGLAGRRDEAQAILDELFETRERTYAAAFNIARVYAGLGDRDRAYEWLERAADERNAEIVHIKRKVVAGQGLYFGNGFSSDPRFIEILRRVGLPLESGKQTRSHTWEISRTVSSDQERRTSVPTRPLTSVESGIETTEQARSDDTGIYKPRSSRSRPVLLGALLLGVVLILGVGAWSVFWRSSGSSQQISTVAVLPFKPIDSASRDESLEMGVAETLITRLGSIGRITVRPLNSVKKFAELDVDPVAAGQESKADAVLTGSLQKAGDRLRVNVRLLDVRSGDTLWSEKFDETFTDIFKVQDAIAERTANALRLQLSASEKERLARRYTDNPEAYQLYLQGRNLYHRRLGNWSDESMGFYTKALEKDPNFALAHVALADALVDRHFTNKMSYNEMMPRVKEHLARAFELDDALAEAYSTSGAVKYQYEYDWAGGRRDFQRAVELDPGSSQVRLDYTFFLLTQGEFDEAFIQLGKAQEIEPDSLTIRAVRGNLLWQARRDDEAIKYLEDFAKVIPDRSATYLTLSGLYRRNGRDQEAIDAFLRGLQLRGRTQEQINNAADAYRKDSWKGVGRAETNSLIERSRTQHVRPMEFVNTYALSGDKDSAFRYLEIAVQEHDPLIAQMKVNPFLDPLRDDPRFAQFLQKINLQP